MSGEPVTNKWWWNLGIALLGGACTLVAALPTLIAWYKGDPPPPPAPIVPLTLEGLVDLERPQDAVGPKVSMRLVPERRDLRQGEQWAVAVTADRNGYVMLIAEEHDPASKRQSVDVLLPNYIAGRSAAKVTAGQTTYFPHPDPGGGEFALEVDDRVSRVTIRAVFTTFPVMVPAADAAALPDEHQAQVFFEYPLVRGIRLVDPTGVGGTPFPSAPPFGEARRADWGIATAQFTTNSSAGPPPDAANEPVEIDETRNPDTR